MKIYHSLTDFTKLDFAVVTSGTFDGVHLGHQQILRRVTEIARKHNGETVVITYWPHPRLILQPDSTIHLLNTFEEKAALLKEYGIHHLIRLTFTKEFSQLNSTEFVKNILVDTIGTRKLVIGYDHRFGKNREGSFEELRKLGPGNGFDVEEIPKQEIDHAAISSTKIREALEDGNVEGAATLLGHPYSIGGEVVKGAKLGRVLGFPTANIDVDSRHKLVPAEGIYAVTVSYEGKSFYGMLYIGNRPTLNGQSRSIEVNIFNFDREIYGETLTVFFHHAIRKDIKFGDLEALKQQLQKDKEHSFKLFGLN